MSLSSATKGSGLDVFPHRVDIYVMATSCMDLRSSPIGQRSGRIAMARAHVKLAGFGCCVRATGQQRKGRAEKGEPIAEREDHAAFRKAFRKEWLL